MCVIVLQCLCVHEFVSLLGCSPCLGMFPWSDACSHTSTGLPCIGGECRHLVLRRSASSIYVEQNCKLERSLSGNDVWFVTEVIYQLCVSPSRNWQGQSTRNHTCPCRLHSTQHWTSVRFHICMTWLICMWDMTHSHVWHDSFTCDSFTYVTWLVHICMTWLICMCKITLWYLWCDLFTFVTWLIHICCVTHSYLWHDSFTCVTWLVHIPSMPPSFHAPSCRSNKSLSWSQAPWQSQHPAQFMREQAKKITKTELEPKFYCRSPGRISGHLFPLFSLGCVTLQETTATCPWGENPASLRYPLMIFNKSLALTPLRLFVGNGTVSWALSN